MLNLNFSLLQMTGLAAVLTGVIILLFSPYRRWLGFMLAGMGYFTFLEAVQYVSRFSFGWSIFQGYMAGLGVSLILLAIWLSVTEKNRQGLGKAAPSVPVEHRPIRMQPLDALESDL